MIGFLFGVSLLIGLPGAVLDRAPEENFGSPWALLLMAIVVVVGAWLVGMLFVKTVGMVALGYSVGSLIAAVLALFTGQAEYTVPLLANAFAGWMIQHGQQHRLEYAVPRF